LESELPKRAQADIVQCLRGPCRATLSAGLDPIRAPLDRSKDRRGGRDEIIAGAGERLVVDRLLEIVVEIFIRGVLRRLGRKVEDLDLVLVVRQPFLNRS
jgi:hypothetical protein